MEVISIKSYNKNNNEFEENRIDIIEIEIRYDAEKPNIDIKKIFIIYKAHEPLNINKTSPRLIYYCKNPITKLIILRGIIVRPNKANHLIIEEMKKSTTIKQQQSPPNNIYTITALPVNISYTTREKNNFLTEAKEDLDSLPILKKFKLFKMAYKLLNNMKIETADQLSHACSIVGTELFERSNELHHHFIIDKRFNINHLNSKENATYSVNLNNVTFSTNELDHIVLGDIHDVKFLANLYSL
ncbi:hypothetical protein H8356DRAFT_1361295 [Neocallimastix lanati (nom. inval.)]|nr:hypothetical protein H8356DRAFT_1361295 [Neocallimastix sp. JGI-2020a]